MEEQNNGRPDNPNNLDEDNVDEDLELWDIDEPQVYADDDDEAVAEDEDENEVEPGGAEVPVHIDLRHEEGVHVRWRDFLAHRLLGRRGRRGQMEYDPRRWFMRHFLRLGENESDDDDDDNESSNQNDHEMLENITFDTNLPASHSYLGEMQECSGAAFQDQDTYQSINILYVHDFVLFPGQTLALQFSRLNEVSMIRRVMEQPDKTFGILMLKYNTVDDNLQTRDLYNFGCTAEIRSFQDREENEITTLRAVVIGRQKFKVMEKRSQMDGNVIAKVKIIVDVDLPELNDSVGIHSRYSLIHNPHPRSNAGDGNFMFDKPLQSNFHKKWSVTRHAAYSTPWPPWIYRMYDASYLRLKIFQEMREWNQKLEEHQCPEGATDFSYWVITKFPLSDEWRLHLLSLQSSIQRLQCELDILQKCTVLTCSDCSHHIADRGDTFCMSVCGMMAAYVNPGGVVHETLTLRKVTGLHHIGRKSTEHSWFPGYAWKICECASCGRHMGWKFTATNILLKPQKFWGLTRAGLTPKVPGFNETSESEQGISSSEQHSDLSVILS